MSLSGRGAVSGSERDPCRYLACAAEHWFAVGLVLLSFFAYIRTLCPTLYVGDSGELIAAANCLGIPHPPGYPVFVLLLRLTATVFPFGAFAYRCALASALLGSASVFCLFRICLLLSSNSSRAVGATVGRLAGPTIASVVFAFSLTFWSQTTIAEVYALTLFVILLILYLVLRWASAPRDARDDRLLLLASFIGGLGLAAHHTVALLLAAFTAYVIYRSPNILRRPGLISCAVVLGLLGAFVHFYLAFRASVNPPLNWGIPDTWSSFVNHVLRREYGSPSHSERSLSLLLGQIGFYLRTLLRQFTPLGLALSVVGAVAAVRKKRSESLLLLAVFLLCSLFFILYTNLRLIPRDKALVEVFFIPSFAVAAILISPGVSFLLRLLQRWSASRSRFSCAVGAAILVICAAPLLANYFYSDKSEHFITYDYGLNILSSMPADDSVIIVDRDMEVFTLLFLKEVEGTAPDIEMIDRSGILRRDFYARNIRHMPAQAKEKAQIAAEHRLFKREKRPILYVPGVDLGGIKDYKLKPVGVATVVVPADRVDEFSQDERSIWMLFSQRGMDDATLFKDYTSRCVVMVSKLQLGDSFYWQGDKERGMRLWNESSEVADDILILHTMLSEKAVQIGETELAIREYTRIAELRPHDYLARINVATLLQSIGRTRDAAEALEESLAIQPDFLPTLKSAANIYVALGDFDKAIEKATRIRELSPQDAEAIRNLGVVYEMAGRLSDALLAYQQAVSARPTFALAYADIGFLKEKMADPEDAKQALQRAVALDPSILSTDSRFASSRIGQSLRDESLARDDEDLSELPKDQLKERIKKLLATQQLASAVRAYRQLIKLEPDNADTVANMAILLDQMGASEEAEAAFKKAVSIDPNSAEAHNGLGVVYAKRGEYQKARQEWERALELKPNSAGTLSNLKQLEQLGY